MRLSARSLPSDLLPSDLEYIYSLAEKGDAATLKDALRSGGTVNFIHPKTTDSPLMIACRRGHVEVVKLCLDFGAKNDPHPDYGQTALHAAVASGRLTCASIILNVAKMSEADTIISNLTDQYGQTPLHTASIIGSVVIAELLLQHGARISSIDNYGQTPLHLCSGSGHKAVLAVLLDHGGDAIIDLPDVYGNSPLHHAAYHGKLECAKLLLETAANVTARNSEGLTAYNLATIHGHQQIGMLIMEYRGGPAFGAEKPMFEQRPAALERPASAPFSREVSINGYYSDSPYGTPLVKGEFSARKPDLRRSATDPYDLGSDLPRPHTVSSPALAIKQSQSRSRLNSLNSSPRGSAQDIREAYTSSPYSDPPNFYEPQDSTVRDAEGGGVYGGYRVVSQLSTPLVIREKRSTQMQQYANASADERFLESPNKVFHGPKIVSDPSPGHHLRLSAQTSTPQRTYSISSDSSADDIQQRLTTPDRKLGRSPTKPSPGHSHAATSSAADTEGYAEPLEVFECCETVWNVYMTEQGDIYYLDMNNSHSQWEDPRVYGFISMESYVEPVPEEVSSPSRMSDSAPPLSPSRMGSASGNEGDDGPRTPTRSLFGWVDEGEGAARVSPKGRLLPEAANGSDSSDSLDQLPKQQPAEVKASKSDPLFDEEEVVSVATTKAKLSNLFGKDGPFKPAQTAPNTEKEKAIPKVDIAAKRDEFEIARKVSAVDKTSAPPKPIDIYAEESQPVPAVTAPPSVEDGITLEFCKPYAEMVQGGKTLQDVRASLESDGFTTSTITKIMAMLDDYLALECGDEASSGGDAAAMKTPVSQKTPAVAVDPVQQQKERLSVLAQAEPSLAKYIRIINMGALPMSVISKMKIEGVEGSLIQKVEVALGLAAAEEKKENKTWQPMPEERMKNSIWAFAALEQSNEALLAEQELADLEAMFRTERESRSRAHPSKIEALQASTKQAMQLKVLESKRAQNISIGLVAFKACGSHGDLLKAVCALNSLDGKLGADHLENLRTLLPTDAEVKMSFKLQHPTHPAEVFMQTALLFYPELPVRLQTFVSCLSFPDHVNAVEKKFRAIMDAINQVLSSTKLAKLLQKLLIVGRVMMQPGGAAKGRPVGGGAGSDGKMTVLEQLLQISNTKAADKKTSVLDYVVRTLYDKSEEGLLGVIDDLSILADPPAPLSSLDAIQDTGALQKALAALEQELSRAQSLASSQDTFSSPTAKAISDNYADRLGDHLTSFRDRMGMVTKRKQLLSKKMRSLMEYFGEDPKEVDCSPIFNALKDFRRALAFSKEAVEWKLYRSGSQQS